MGRAGEGPEEEAQLGAVAASTALGDCSQARGDRGCWCCALGKERGQRDARCLHLPWQEDVRAGWQRDALTQPLLRALRSLLPAAAALGAAFPGARGFADEQPRGLTQSSVSALAKGSLSFAICSSSLQSTSPVGESSTSGCCCPEEVRAMRL